MEEKVVLIQLNDSGRSGFVEWELPLNHIHLSYSLRQNGFTPVIYEVSCDHLNEIVDRVIEEEPLFIGIGAIFDYFAIQNLEFSLKIRQRKSIPILWGGSAVTMSPNLYLQESDIDFICCGEGEIPIVEFAKYLKGELNITNVPGLGYKSKGKPTFNQVWHAENLKDIGFDFEAIKFLDEDKEKFKKYVRNDGVLFSMRASKGCPYKCTFCYNSGIKNKFRMFDIDKVVNGLLYVKNHCDFSSVRLIDDLLFINKPWAYELLESLQNNNISIFNVDSRAEDFTEPFMEKMREYKLHSLFFGFESYYDKILKLYNKKTSTKALKNVLNISNLYPDIKLSCQVIIGAPGTTKEEVIRECINYLNLLDKYLINITIVVYRPLPGTQLYYKAIENGFKPLTNLKDLSKWFLTPLNKIEVDIECPWIAKNEREKQFFRRITYVSMHCVYLSSVNQYVGGSLLKKYYWPFVLKRMRRRFENMDLAYIWEIHLIRFLYFCYMRLKSLAKYTTFFQSRG